MLYAKLIFFGLLLISNLRAECPDALNNLLPTIPEDLADSVPNVGCQNGNTRNLKENCECEASRFPDSEINAAIAELNNSNLLRIGDKSLAFFAGHSSTTIYLENILSLFGQSFEETNLESTKSCQIDRLNELANCDLSHLNANISRLYGEDVKNIDDLKKRIKETKKLALLEGNACSYDQSKNLSSAITNTDLRNISLIYEIEMKKNEIIEEFSSKDNTSMNSAKTLEEYATTTHGMFSPLMNLVENSVLLKFVKDSPVFFSNLKNEISKSNDDDMINLFSKVLASKELQNQMYKKASERCDRTLKNLSKTLCGDLASPKLLNEKFNSKLGNGNIDFSSIGKINKKSVQSAAYCKNFSKDDHTVDLDLFLSDGYDELPRSFALGIGSVSETISSDNETLYSSNEHCSYKPNAEAQFKKENCKEVLLKDKTNSKCLRIKAQMIYFDRLKEVILTGGILKENEDIDDFLASSDREKRSSFLANYIFEGGDKFYRAQNGKILKIGGYSNGVKNTIKNPPASPGPGISSSSLEKRGQPFSSDLGGGKVAPTSPIASTTFTSASNALNTSATNQSYISSGSSTSEKKSRKPSKNLAQNFSRTFKNEGPRTLDKEITELKQKMEKLQGELSSAQSENEKLNDRLIMTKKRQLAEIEEQIAQKEKLAAALRTDEAAIAASKGSERTNSNARTFRDDYVAKPSYYDWETNNLDVIRKGRPGNSNIGFERRQNSHSLESIPPRNGKEVYSEISLARKEDLTVMELLKKNAPMNKPLKVNFETDRDTSFNIVLVCRNNNTDDCKITPLSLAKGKKLPKNQLEILSLPGLKPYVDSKLSYLNEIILQLKEENESVF